MVDDLRADFFITNDERNADMNRCADCKNLKENGGCRAAARGLIPGVLRSYKPVQNVYRRCEEFKA